MNFDKFILVFTASFYRVKEGSGLLSHLSCCLFFFILLSQLPVITTEKHMQTGGIRCEALYGKGCSL